MITNPQLHEIRSRVWAIMLAQRTGYAQRVTLELGKLDNYVRDLQMELVHAEEDDPGAPF